MFKKALMALAVLLATAAPVMATPKPHLHLGGGKLDSLYARNAEDRNDTYIDYLYRWCNAHYNDYIPAEVVNESPVYAVSSMAMRNFALAYKINPYSSTNMLYGERAIEVLMYGVKNPPRGGNMWGWMFYSEGYAMRSWLYSAAVVYDWCYDLMSASEKMIVREALTECVRGFYTSAHASGEDKIWGAGRPHNNYHYGEMLGLAAAILAIEQDTATVTAAAKTFLIDTMVVQMQVGLWNGTREFIDSYEVYGDSIGRDKGGLRVEGTSYGSVDNACMGLLVDLLVRGDSSGTRTIHTLVHDYPEQVIAATIYSTYPNNTINDTRYNTLGEGTAGYGDLDYKKARMLTVMAALSSDADTAGVAKTFNANKISYSSTDGDGYILSEFVLFEDATVAQVDPDTVLTAKTRYHSGPQILCVRDGASMFGDDAMLLSLRGGVINEDHGHNGFGHVTWQKGGYLLADPALLKDDGNEIYINDYYHNTVAVDTSAAGFNSWTSKLYYGSSTLEHSAATADYVYYAFDMTSPYTAQAVYKGNTVLHKEREFFYVPSDTTLFLLDRTETYAHRISKAGSWALDTLDVDYVYPSTWTLYSQGTIDVANASFLVTPVDGSYELAGFVATPDTNLSVYKLEEDPAETLDKLSDGTLVSNDVSVLRYRKWMPDSQSVFGAVLWANTEAHPDSLRRVDVIKGSVLGLYASTGEDWHGNIVVFATDSEGDTGSVWSNDSIRLVLQAPADTMDIYVVNLCSAADSFAYVVSHYNDTLIVSLQRTLEAGWTRCVATTAGVVHISSKSAGTGGTDPVRPDPPDKGGGEPLIPGKADDGFFIGGAIMLGRKRKWLGFLAGVLLACTPALADTGWNYDNSNSSGIKYIFTYNGYYFYPDYLTVTLDATASGPLTIIRYINTTAIDSTSALSIRPGGSVTVPASGTTRFVFAKTSASDVMRWIAHNSDVAVNPGGVAEYLAIPPTRTWQDFPVLTSTSITSDSTDIFAPTSGAGIPTMGATSILLQFSWTGADTNDVTGLFITVYRCGGFSAADQTMTFPIDSARITNAEIERTLASPKRVNLEFKAASGYFPGYTFFRIKGNGADAADFLWGTQCTARVVW